MCTAEIRQERTLPAVDCLDALHYETLFTDRTQKIENSSTGDTHTRLSHSYFTLFLGHYKKLFSSLHTQRETRHGRRGRGRGELLPEHFQRGNCFSGGIGRGREEEGGRWRQPPAGAGTAVLLPPVVDDGSGYPVFLFPPLLRYTTELN